ncbi:MAG: hypothetical protein N3A38_10215 [Planctomycetota bacterium]|nr:hypothetical protein [Planctomycetota bacterium]
MAEKVCGWEPVGLSGGGAMFVPVISRANPDLMMINCDMSGSYISRDGGRTWKMIHWRQRMSNTQCAPAMHPSDPRVIAAPAGWGSGRLLITADGGETWRPLGDAGAPLSGEIVFDPDDPRLMLAGTRSGAAISRDGGATWARCAGISGAAISCCVDRTSPPGGRRLFVASADGIWRSDDGGASWAEKTKGLPWKKILSFRGASDPKTGRAMLYCSVESRVQDGKFAGGIYRSADGGGTWESAMGSGINMETKATGEWADGPVAQYRHVLAADADPMRVYAFNTSTSFWPPGHPTCFRSDDGGRNWRPTWYQDPRFREFNCEHNYHTASTGQAYQGCPIGAAICPSDSGRILTTDDMRVFVTRDGGARWLCGHCLPSPGRAPGPGSAWLCNGLVVTTTWCYYVDPHQRNRHYIAYTDIGFARSLDGGRSWIWWEKNKWAPWRNTCYELAFDPDVPGKAWGAFSDVHDIPNANIISGRHRSRGGGGVCISADFCESWKPCGEGLPKAPVTSIALDRKSSAGSRTLYAGIFGGGVYKSADDGRTWKAANSGLGHPDNMNVCRVAVHADGTVFALVTATVGGFREDGVGLYRSRDGGGSWERITAPLGLLWPKDFAVHPSDSRIIFIGAADAGGRKQGGLYRTADGGASWKRVARFGAEHFGAYFHPKRPGWVYATMCEGAPEKASLWLSTDNGESWRPFESFPFANTMRVTVAPDDPDVIYVSTFGGSVFRGPAEPR